MERSFRNGRPAQFAAVVALTVWAFASQVLAQDAAGKPQPIAIVKANRATAIDFEKDVLPIFRKHCLACHSATEEQGGLVLETPATILQGGDTGPGVVATNSAESLLLKLAAHQAEPVMPPPDNYADAPPLTGQQLGIIQQWIDEGATGTVSTALSPQEWRPLPRGVNPIYAAAVSRDGQIAACSRANQIFVYHVPTGQLITRLTDPQLQEMSRDDRPGIAHLDSVQSLTFNAAGDLLASGGFRTIKLWRRPQDVQRFKLPAPAELTAVAASVDADVIATGMVDGKIQLWDRATGQAGPLLTGHTAEITGLDLSDDGRLISSAVDGTLRIWNVADGSHLARVDTPTPINDVALLSGGERFATAGSDNFVRHWNLPGSLSQPYLQTVPQPQVLATSLDGQLLASGNAEGFVQVVDFGCGQLVDQQWQAHAAAITSLAFSGQTSELVTGSADGTISVWDYTTGEKLGTFTGTLNQVTSVAFRNDGLQVASGSSEGYLTLWNLQAEADRALALVPGAEPSEPVEVASPATETQPQIALQPNGAAAKVLALSIDGKLVASTGVADGRPVIHVRDFATGEVKQTFFGHDGEITSLAFHPAGTQLVSAAGDGTARVWQLGEAKFPEISTFAEHASPVTSVAFNTNGTQVVSAGSNGTVKVWNSATGELVSDLPPHEGAVQGLAFVANNAQVVSAGQDQNLRFVNVADGKLVRAIPQEQAVSRLAITRDAARVAIARAGGVIALYNVADGKLLIEMPGHAEAVHSLAFSPDGTRLVSGDATRSLVWNSATGRLLEALPAEQSLTSTTFGPANGQVLLATADTALTLHTLRFALAAGEIPEQITSLVYRPDGQMLYAASRDGTVRGFQTSTGQQSFAANHGSPVRALAYSSTTLASGGADKVVKLWNPSNGAPLPNGSLAALSGEVTSLAFTPDERRLVAGLSTPGEIPVIEVNNREVEQLLSENTGAAVSLVATQSLGPRIVVADDAGEVRSYELAARGRLSGHSMPVTSVAAVPGNPDQVLSGSLDGTLRHWNLVNGQVIRTFNHGGPVTDVAARPDGQRFASASENNTARLWNPANGQTLATMTGDLRRRTELARLQQEMSLATSKLTATEAELKAAQDDAPKKAATAKTTSDALTVANNDVAAKQTAFEKATTDKAAAEKKAVEAAATAQALVAAKLQADLVSITAAADAQRAMDKATRAVTLAKASPDDAPLAAMAEKLSAAATEAQAAAKAAADKATDATTKATAARKLADDAAAAAVALGKPFNDAATALATAQDAQDKASQLSAVAMREAMLAQELVPQLETVLADTQKRATTLEAAIKTAEEAITASEMPIRSVAFSPDGQLLATGGDFQAVHTWNAEDGKAVATFAGHAGSVLSVNFAGPTEIVSIAADNSAVSWDAEPSWILERTIGDISQPAILADRVVTLDFNRDGALLAAGSGVPSRFGEVKVFQVADGSLALSLPDAHADSTNGVAFSRDGTRLASCGSDKYVRVWKMDGGELLRSFEGHTEAVLSVDWQAGDKVLASAGADNVIRVWNADNGDQTRAIAGYNKQVTSVQFVGETPNIVTSSGDTTVHLQRTDNGQNLRTFTGGTDFMYCATVTPPGDVVIGGGHDSVLRIWNGTNGQVLHTLPPPAPPAPADSAATKEVAQSN